MTEFMLESGKQNWKTVPDFKFRKHGDLPYLLTMRYDIYDDITSTCHYTNRIRLPELLISTFPSQFRKLVNVPFLIDSKIPIDANVLLMGIMEKISPVRTMFFFLELKTK